VACPRPSPSLKVLTLNRSISQSERPSLPLFSISLPARASKVDLKKLEKQQDKNLSISLLPSTNSKPQQSYEEMFMQVTESSKVGDQTFNSRIGQLSGCTSLFQRQDEISSLLARADGFLAFEGKSKDIHLPSIDVSFGSNRILAGASLTLAHGRRYGLIGR
jgi:ATP-binding cassette subfamily F protein 3